MAEISIHKDGSMSIKFSGPTTVESTGSAPPAEVGQIDQRAIIESQKVALEAAKQALEQWRYVEIGQYLDTMSFLAMKAQTESAIEKIEALA